MPNDKITAVGANIAEKAAMIWNVADMLRGPFKPHEYGGHSAYDRGEAVPRLPAAHPSGSAGHLRKGEKAAGHRRLFAEGLRLPVL